MMQLCFLTGGMLRCSGNMRCTQYAERADVYAGCGVQLFSYFPFPSHFSVWDGSVYACVPDGGVAGAALGTGLAELVVAGLMLWFLVTRSSELGADARKGTFSSYIGCIEKGCPYRGPMGIEHAVICGAQILTTVIVAPLGVFAIAANSFAITAESLCYMPGYGIADAATTLVGQSMGAGRRDLTRAVLPASTVGMGMTVMGIMGVIMYVAAPLIIGTMTPDAEVLELGVRHCVSRLLPNRCLPRQ